MTRRIRFDKLSRWWILYLDTAGLLQKRRSTVNSSSRKYLYKKSITKQNKKKAFAKTEDTKKDTWINSIRLIFTSPRGSLKFFPTCSWHSKLILRGTWFSIFFLSSFLYIFTGFALAQFSLDLSYGFFSQLTNAMEFQVFGTRPESLRYATRTPIINIIESYPGLESLVLTPLQSEPFGFYKRSANNRFTKFLSLRINFGKSDDHVPFNARNPMNIHGLLMSRWKMEKKRKQIPRCIPEDLIQKSWIKSSNFWGLGFFNNSEYTYKHLNEPEHVTNFVLVECTRWLYYAKIRSNNP